MKKSPLHEIITPISIGILICIFFSNIIRFFGLEYSPPSFYVDEAYAAVQILCIQLSGRDFFGVQLPLFAISGPGVAIYTPPFLYGEVIWTSIFGNTVTGFRSFIAFVTVLTVLILFLYAKKRVGLKAALWITFSASIMPWSFVFSRIAWDPPLAVLFLALFLWTSTFSKFYWIAGIFLAIAAYSYPPMRLMAPMLVIFMPELSVRRKALLLAIAGIICIPMAWLTLSNPHFMIRSHMLAIWSTFYGNPYRNAEIGELLKVIWTNFSSHFSFNFLFLHGEQSLRSSIQTFGMLSWLDLSAYSIVPFLLFWKKLKNKNELFFSSAEKQMIFLGIIGVALSFLPSSLTNETPPHALRSVTAWLFFALLTGILINKFIETTFLSIWSFGFIALGGIFFSFFIWSYFVNYPNISKEAFQMDYFTAYSLPKLQNGNSQTCSDIRYFMQSSAKAEIKVCERIIFSDNVQRSHKFLWDNWHDKEAWGVWSNGKKASLYLPKRDRASHYLDLELKSLITGNHPVQKVQVKINGISTEILISSAKESVYKIPISSLTNEDIWMEIETPNAISPEQAGFGNGDKRKLGVGLISVEFN